MLIAGWIQRRKGIVQLARAYGGGS
jgi:hypothetical protein